MVRRSFRMGLRIGLLAGVLLTVVKVVRLRRSGREEPAWPPLQPEPVTVEPPAATVTSRMRSDTAPSAPDAPPIATASPPPPPPDGATRPPSPLPPPPETATRPPSPIPPPPETATRPPSPLPPLATSPPAPPLATSPTEEADPASGGGEPTIGAPAPSSPPAPPQGVRPAESRADPWAPPPPADSAQAVPPMAPEPPAAKIAEKAAGTVRKAAVRKVSPGRSAGRSPAGEAAPARKRVRKARRQPWVEPLGQDTPTSHPVKAKLTSMLYHLPGMAFYDRTRPDRCYIDAAAAEADGFIRSKR